MVLGNHLCDRLLLGFGPGKVRRRFHCNRHNPVIRLGNVRRLDRTKNWTFPLILLSGAKLMKPSRIILLTLLAAVAFFVFDGRFGIASVLAVLFIAGLIVAVAKLFVDRPGSPD
jgi:uncharacterized membrane protein YqjE